MSSNLTKKATGAVLGITLALVIPIDSQSKQAESVRVEVTTSKKVYYAGEPIVYRAILVNTGPSAVYVSKNFGAAGGGYAGFYATVKQLSGKSADIGCVIAGDRGISIEARTPEQILKEDYLRLAPSEFVGFEGVYSGCIAKYAGKYQITVQYFASDIRQPELKDLKINSAAVLEGTYQSKPVTFVLH